MTDSPGPTILVIDASDFFRNAICGVLREEGRAFRSAACLADAAQDCLDPEVGLFILDLESTGPDAIELIRAVRSERPETRAIVLAAQAGQDDALAALRAGACDYLAKPLHEEELRLAVGRAVAGFETEVELARLRRGEASARQDVAIDADLDLARDLCEAVVAEGDPAGLPERLLAILGERMGATGASLHLAEPGGRGFRREAFWEAGALRDRESLAGGRGLSGAAAATGSFIASADPQTDSRFDPEVDTPGGDSSERTDPPAVAPSQADGSGGGGRGGLMVLPLRFRRNTVGLVRVFLAEGAEPSLRTAEMAGAALSAALRSVLLYRSWRSSIDEVARIRRESADPRRNPAPGNPSPNLNPGWVSPSSSRTVE